MGLTCIATARPTRAAPVPPACATPRTSERCTDLSTGVAAFRHAHLQADISMLRPDTLALTALLALITALGPVSTDMYLPSLPDIGRLLSASPAEVQLTLSAYLAGFALGQVGYGPLSDHYGRKPVLLIALALFCAGNVACAAAPRIDVLIAARALQAM